MKNVKRSLAFLLSLIICIGVFSAGIISAQAETTYSFCDVNGDGKISTSDARITLRHAVKIAILSDEQLSVADVNGDNEVTITDARRILRIAVKIDELPMDPRTMIAGAACGTGNSFFVIGDGTLWAIGLNEKGQLGIGNNVNQETLVKVSDNVSAVSSGGEHTLILKKDGTLWATGGNSVGQLGNGGTTNVNTPVKIMDDVISFSAAYSYSAAVTRDGTLYAWGYNSGGQMNTTEKTVLSPKKITDNCKSVATAYYAILAIKNDNTLWYSLESERTIAENVTNVQAGREFFVYLTSDNEMYAYGLNNSGQLGNGTNNDADAKTGPVFVSSDVSAMAAGNTHTLYVKKDGTLWATGKNDVGQLGDGTTNNKSTPVKIADDVRGVFAGENSSIFTKTDNSLWAFGNNKFKQLTGTSPYVLTPQEILF